MCTYLVHLKHLNFYCRHSSVCSIPVSFLCIDTFTYMYLHFRKRLHVNEAPEEIILWPQKVPRNTVVIKGWILSQKWTRSCYLPGNPWSWHSTAWGHRSHSANDSQGSVSSPHLPGKSVPALVTVLSCSFFTLRNFTWSFRANFKLQIQHSVCRKTGAHLN